MGEEQPAGDERQPDRSRPREAGQQVLGEQERSEDAEHDERVHPGLGRVAEVERRDGHDQQDACRADPAAPAPAGNPRERQRGDGDDARQGPDGDIATSEDLDPAVEQHVVERRVAILAERLGDVAQGQARDVDAEGLVEPERRLGGEAEHHEERYHTDQSDAFEAGQGRRCRWGAVLHAGSR